MAAKVLSGILAAAMIINSTQTACASTQADFDVEIEEIFLEEESPDEELSEEESEEIIVETPEEEEEIVITRTKKFPMKPMDPEEACIEMELTGHNFFVFRNSETEQVNVVYKRKGNTYGLIEPEY